MNSCNNEVHFYFCYQQDSPETYIDHFSFRFRCIKINRSTTGVLSPEAVPPQGRCSFPLPMSVVRSSLLREDLIKVGAAMKSPVEPTAGTEVTM